MTIYARLTVSFFCLMLFAISSRSAFCADKYEVNGIGYKAMRAVRLPEWKPIIVTGFYHQGLLPIEGSCGPHEVAVVAKTGRKPVACKVLQLGPGDFCKLAFEATEKVSEYNVYYGLLEKDGKNVPEPPFPDWKNRSGLIMETRVYEQCNLNDAASLKAAFDKAKRIGSDYVDGVNHGMNPFILQQGPFFSRYTGTLNVAQAGDYGIFTSSQDCSFLFIDGKLAASAPGRHGPVHRAKPENMNMVTLNAGRHDFEYLHAATGDSAYTLFAWKFNPDKQKPAPETVPPEAFDFGSIARVLPGNVDLAGSPQVPDYISRITGNVPLPDNPDNMVCVVFENKSPAAVKGHGKCRWDFGDGLTGTDADPVHIYLRPGIYPVKLTYMSGETPMEIANRVYVERPLLLQSDKPHELDNYLPIIQKYDPKKLDAASAMQLLQAYLMKIDLLREQGGDSALPPKTMEEIRKLQKSAVEAALGAIADNPKNKGDAEVYRLAKTASPMARDILDDPKTAGQIWFAASQKLANDDQAAECIAAAADIMLNDLLDSKKAKPLIDSAVKRLPGSARGGPAAAVYRILGEYHASTGDRKAAREAFAKAGEINSSRKSFGEKIALEGAFSRSAEGFIREKNFDRAIIELRQWQYDYPGAYIDGYIYLLFAEYWYGKGKFEHVAATADRLIALNPDSGYADRILALAADAQTKAGNSTAALAYLHQLLKEYPGSSLIEETKANLRALEK